MKKFVLIGSAGYIAPKHLKAIKETGNILVASMDKFDSVGIMDDYFPDADFFTEFERFDRFVSKQFSGNNPIDYLSVCTPNHLHDAHIRFGLRSEMNVICEKPVVLNPWNLDALINFEKKSGKKVFTILQLRYHPEIVKLKEKIESASNNDKHAVSIKYITPRGNWYQRSWKGDIEKSGGIATNIGIHLFDMLIWIFGDVVENHVDYNFFNKAAGKLVLEKADIHWLLSIDSNDLPVNNSLNKSFRSIVVDGNEIEFSDGFTDLHTESYKSILQGYGFGLADVKKSIDLVYQIRNK